MNTEQTSKNIFMYSDGIVHFIWISNLHNSKAHFETPATKISPNFPMNFII